MTFPFRIKHSIPTSNGARHNILVITGLALGIVWPAGIQAQTEPATTQDIPYQAVITEARSARVDGQEVWTYRARFSEGPQAREVVTIGDDEGPTNLGFKNFAVGDRVYVSVIQHIDGTERYLIVDYVRSGSLWWLVGLFVLAIIWFSRWRGLRSLIGLAISFVVLIGWIVPQIANGANPVGVTIAGATVILLVSIVLIEGWTRASLAAIAGTVTTMILTGLISLWAVGFSRLTGEGTEEAFILQGASNGTIDVRGLLLAGIIIGTLGILDDLAISQVAAVSELRRANPKMKRRELFQAAMRIGRSHLAAIVNTLVLAYAGASLPLLVLFNLGGQPSKFILNGELVATEIVRSIVGSLGLVLALPITTAMAVWLGVETKHSHPELISH